MKRKPFLFRMALPLFAFSALLTGCVTEIHPRRNIFPSDPVPDPVDLKKTLPDPDNRPSPIPMPVEGTFPVR